MKDIDIKSALQNEDETISADDVEVGEPAPQDGAAVHELISDCPPLDTNSMYCNLLQCTHFAETSAIAKVDGRPYGFVSGYLNPDDPSILFIWQVAVHEDARGTGLGKKMLSDILNRAACEGVEKVQTTITRDNKASWGLFKSWARDLDADCDDEVLFSRKDHFKGNHASEHLLTIGPFSK
jgi:L-2,4-diaminobutyric acid acetyltransferase